jgi:hypothetical protein
MISTVQKPVLNYGAKRTLRKVWSFVFFGSGPEGSGGSREVPPGPSLSLPRASGTLREASRIWHKPNKKPRNQKVLIKRSRQDPEPVSVW